MKYLVLWSWLGIIGFLIDSEPKVDVYVFLHDECIISRYYTLPLNEMHEAYSDIAHIVGVFPNPQMDSTRLSNFKNEYNIAFDLVQDADFDMTKALGATITPEVFVINRSTEEVLYAGRIDNAYARVGKKRPVPTRFELREVLQQIKDKKPITVEPQPAIGCHITTNKLSIK